MEHTPENISPCRSSASNPSPFRGVGGLWFRYLSAFCMFACGLGLLAYGCCTAPPGVIDYSVTVATALCFVTGCTLLGTKLELPALK